MDDWDLPPLTFTEGMPVGVLERISEARIRKDGKTDKRLTAELDKLKTQAMAIDEIVNRYKLNVVNKWQEAGSASKKPPSERETIKNILEYARLGKIKALLVYAPDRITRYKPWHGMFIIEQLYDADCVVYSYAYNWLDIRTDFRAKWSYDLLWYACMESHGNSIRVRQRRAREIAEAAKEQRAPKLGGWPKLELTMEQQDKIKNYYNSGNSINDIISLMAREGINVTEWYIKKVLGKV